jgi:hypothetical protein
MGHLKENNITYFKHFTRSIVFASQSLKASITFTIHAFFPDLFTDTGSNIIKELRENFPE